MITYGLAEYAAAGGTPPRPAQPLPADPVAILARAMLELEAEGQAVDAAALQARTRLPMAVIDASAQPARERAYAMASRSRARPPAEGRKPDRATGRMARPARSEAAAGGDSVRAE